MKQALVVDDSAVIRRVARRLLETLRFASVEAEDGAAALYLYAEKKPDLILLDWAMPGVDSIDFLRNLRKLPGGDQPKILYCATENDELLIGRALRAGADDVLFKPFDRTSLQEKLEDVGLI